MKTREHLRTLQISRLLLIGVAIGLMALLHANLHDVFLRGCLGV